MIDKIELIINILKNSGKPMKTAEISELIGLPKTDVSKIIAKLKKEDKIISPKRCFYEVK
jgi:uncharacterized membrane protein